MFLDKRSKSIKFRLLCRPNILRHLQGRLARRWGPTSQFLGNSKFPTPIRRRTPALNKLRKWSFKTEIKPGLMLLRPRPLRPVRLHQFLVFLLPPRGSARRPVRTSLQKGHHGGFLSSSLAFGRRSLSTSIDFLVRPSVSFQSRTASPVGEVGPA
jgi:hypothetical protein